MIKRTYIYLLFFLWEYVFYLTLQNGACVKSASQYEWKCIEVNKEGYCDLPMENKDIRNGSGFQNENGPDGHYDTAHKGCFFSTREDCEKNKCEWRSGGNPLSLGKIPVCADKSAPNDRSKDSKNRKADCKVPIPDCGSKVPQPGCESEDHTTVDIGFPRQVNFVNCKNIGVNCGSELERRKWISDETTYYYFIGKYGGDILYVPIDYYVSHPDAGVEGELEINADVGNSEGVENTTGTYYIKTNKEGKIGLAFMQIPFDKQINKFGSRYERMPCNTSSESLGGCRITIKNAKLKLPMILNKDPRCWNCVLDYGEKKCMPLQLSLGLQYGDPSLKWFYCPYRTVAGKKVLTCPTFKSEEQTEGREVLAWNRLSVAKSRGMSNRWNKPLWISLNLSGSPEFKGVGQDFWDDTLSQNVCLANHKTGLGKCVPVMETDLLPPGEVEYSPFEINLNSTSGNNYHVSINLDRRFKEIKGIINERGEIFKDWNNINKLYQANGGSLCKITKEGYCDSKLQGIDCDFVANGHSESECRALSSDPYSCKNKYFCALKHKN